MSNCGQILSSYSSHSLDPSVFVRAVDRPFDRAISAAELIGILLDQR